MKMLSPGEVVRRTLALHTHHIHSLPVLVLMPHSRCNCRCVMCDIWKANRNGQEISRDALALHVEALRRLHVRWVVLSGGEPLMHSNLWSLCELLKEIPARITLLSTGLLLARHAADVVCYCDEVIVSLDGHQPIHDAIRDVPRAFDRLKEGVAALKRVDPAFRVTGRSVIQRRNYRAMGVIIEAAHAIGMDGISFLAADVSTKAFNRAEPWGEERAGDVALSLEEAEEFAVVVEEVIARYGADLASGFIAEDSAKLRRLPHYFAALHGRVDFPPVRCNAPWVSTVVEADGMVKPCFFHRALGNIHERPLDAILNSEEAVSFRRALDVTRDPICQKCVCTLYLGPRAPAAPE